MAVDDRLIELWEESGARASGVPLSEFQTDEIARNPLEPHIGFCTTIQGPERFPILLRSLMHNLEVFNKKWQKEHYRPNVHFLLLAYGEPEFEEFLLKELRERKDFQIDMLREALEKGIVVLSKTEADHFEFANAKNMAARTAMDCLGCSVICNVDSDNYFGGGRAQLSGGNEDAPDFITFLSRVFKRNRDSFVRPVRTDEEELGTPLMRGIGGRIAMSAFLFRLARGYDEENYALWGGDDQNLMERVMAIPVQGGYRDEVNFISLENPDIVGFVEEHDHEYRWQNLPSELQEESKNNEERSTNAWMEKGGRSEQMSGMLATILSERRKMPVIFANPNGWKGDSVQVGRYDPDRQSFEFEERELMPLEPLTEAQKILNKTVYSTDVTGADSIFNDQWFFKRAREKLAEMPPESQEAVIYAAQKRRGRYGYEAIGRTVVRLLRELEEKPFLLDGWKQEYGKYVNDKAALSYRVNLTKGAERERDKTASAYAGASR